MSPTEGPNDRNPTDADDGVPDWDLSVTPLDESDATPDGTPVAQVSDLSPVFGRPSVDDRFDVTAIEPQVIATDQALDEEDGPDTDTESVDCYQSHFLEDDEPETEYVAHVDAAPSESPAVPPVVPLQRTDVEQVQPETPPIAARTVVAAESSAVVRIADSDALTAALVGRTHGPETVTPATQENEPVDVSEAVDDFEDPGSFSEARPSAMPTPGTDVRVQEIPPAWASVQATPRRSPMATREPSFSPKPLPGVGMAPDDEDDPSDAKPVEEIASDIACADADRDLDEPTVPYAATYAEAVYAESWDGSSDPNPDSDAFQESLPTATGGGWTIPLMCLGIAIIAFCMVIPQADANRRLAYERSSLRADLESVQQQVATNDEFLRKLASDPTLAERLAQRQLNLQRAGTKALAIGIKDTGTSPFDLVKVAPPPAVEPYEAVGGKLAAVCRDGKSRLYLMGVGLFVLAAGLMLGVSSPRR